MTRVLVTGGRDYRHPQKVWDELAKLNPYVIIQGGCASGADAAARKYADDHGVFKITYDAPWKIGYKAGPKRNYFMVNDSQPDVVLAFPGGKGTANCIKEAECAGLRIRIIEDGQDD